MEEKRKCSRVPLKLKLFVNNLFMQNNEVLDNANIDLEVRDISTTGISFFVKSEESKLPLNYYFDTKIIFPDGSYIYTVIKIIRKQKVEQGCVIGCMFVGLADILVQKIINYKNSL